MMTSLTNCMNRLQLTKTSVNKSKPYTYLMCTLICNTQQAPMPSALAFCAVELNLVYLAPDNRQPGTGAQMLVFATSPNKLLRTWWSLSCLRLNQMWYFGLETTLPTTYGTIPSKKSLSILKSLQISSKMQSKILTSLFCRFMATMTLGQLIHKTLVPLIRIIQLIRLRASGVTG